MRTVEERFWQKVDKSGDCWMWTAATDKHGYPIFTVGKEKVKGYRWSWENVNGPIPAGLEFDHLCNVPGCVNPDHVEPVTHRENMLRAAARRNQTHCRHGHEFTPENTYRDKKHGYRSCVICRVEANRRCEARKRALRDTDQ